MVGVMYEYPHKRKKIYQIFPILCGYLLAISFGTMLGWSSHAYPFLMSSSSPIPIKLGQTATITSFLWKGNIFGALLSTSRRLGAKNGVLLAAAIQLLGWIVMCGANSFTELLLSRFLIGFGSGFGVGQLKMYTRDTCQNHLVQKLNTYMSICSPLGIFITFVLSVFVPFRSLSAICTSLPLVTLLFFAAAPNRPKYMEEKKVAVVRNIVDDIKTEKIKEVTKTYKQYSIEDNQLSVFEALSDGTIRHSMLLVTILVVVQRVSGEPPHVIFSELIYKEAGNPYPQLCVVIYGFVFLMTTLVAIHFTERFPRKYLLVTCFAISSLLMSVMLFYFYYKEDILNFDEKLSWIPLPVTLTFNMVHTFGIRTVAQQIIKDIFPANAKDFAGIFYVVVFSLSALLITKSFQTLYDFYGIYTGYILMTSVAVLSAVFISIFYKQSLPLIKEQIKRRPDSPIDEKDKHVCMQITNL